MSHTFYYQHGGTTHGPYSASQLKELARSGKLASSDLIRRDDMTQWQLASKFKGLFHTAESVPSGPASHQVAPMAPIAVEQKSITAEAEPLVLQASSKQNVKQMFIEQMDKLKPVAERFAKELELDTRAFVAALAGTTFLLVLVLSTFLAWEFNSIEGGEALKGMGNSVYHAGLHFPEGKWVCFFAVVGIAGLFASFIVKSVLPYGLLLAGAMGTASLFFAFSAVHQINQYNVEIDHFNKTFASNAEKMGGPGAGKEVSKLLVPKEIDVACFGLHLATLASLIIAVTFVFASLFKMVRLPFLQKESMLPFAQKYGALLIFQGVALLVGLTGYIWRY